MELGRTPKCDRYLLLGNGGKGSILGCGSYGKVVPAWDQEEERLAAIKQQRSHSETAKQGGAVVHIASPPFGICLGAPHGIASVGCRSPNFLLISSGVTSGAHGRGG